MDLSTVDKIIDFAITQEEKAAEFYTDLANRMDRAHMKQAFLDYAEEERGHKAKLLVVKAGNTSLLSEQRVQDLKVGDYLKEAKPSSGLNYQEALILAMKAEKAAFRLYQDLASATDDAGLKAVLLGLAQEEAKHKLRFEVEYDEDILREN